MNPPNLTLTAATQTDLLSQLAKLDITVPLVTEGRRKEHREQYMMARFLATKASDLSFPLRVEHTDGPDFILTSGSNVMGVECVEAVPQELYEIEVLRENEYPDAMNFGQKFRPGERTFTREERRQVASGQLAGSPWMPEGAKRKWIAAMEYFIIGKTAKLNRGNYAAANTMWLLVQDEWPNTIQYYPKQQLDAALRLTHCLARQLNEASFETIFIASGSLLLAIRKQELCAQPVQDLWRDA